VKKPRRDPGSGIRGPKNAQTQRPVRGARKKDPGSPAPDPGSPLVLKLGGELLEQPQELEQLARGIAALAKVSPLVVVHGGGREIDAALATAGIPKQQVDGLRVTDARTLDVVVAVLAGAINTRLVAALRGAGAKPVGLTGADTAVATVRRAAPIATVAGPTVDLGLVGAPTSNGAPQLLTDLLAKGYVPVVACIGATRTGELLNVNADTFASHLAIQLGARRLVIAGGTAGVLDDQGQTIDRLTSRAAAQLIRAGTANKGMVAKLEACRAALRKGVGDVVVANGRQVRFAGLAGAAAPAAGCTQVVR
jgi:acetylglutamate kinase